MTINDLEGHLKLLKTSFNSLWWKCNIYLLLHDYQRRLDSKLTKTKE